MPGESHNDNEFVGAADYFAIAIVWFKSKTYSYVRNASTLTEDTAALRINVTEGAMTLATMVPTVDIFSIRWTSD